MKPVKWDLLLSLLIPTQIFGALLILFPDLFLPSGQSRAAGLTLMIISLYASGRIPEFLTTLLFFLVAMLFHIASAATVFSGFHSTALWLVFGGLILGVAIRETGLGQLLAKNLSRYLQSSYPKLIIGMGLVGFGFAFIMPSSMGRIVLLTPIALALADHFDFRPGSNGRTAILLATTLSSFIPAFTILPANVPNMVLSGLAETQFGLKMLFGEYLLLHFPILGILKFILIIAVVLRLYPDQTNSSQKLQDNDNIPGKLSSQQKTLATVLAILVALWACDFLHHVSPAWISLAGAVFLMLPWVGIVPAKAFNTQVNFASLFFIAGILGLGNVIASSGLGNTLGHALISILPFDIHTPFINYLAMILASSTVGLATTLPGIPAVMTPLATEVANATGFSVKAILMLQVVSFSTLLIPYQAPPVIIVMQLSGEKMGRILRPILMIAALTVLVLLPLDYLWWKLLGWI